MNRILIAGAALSLLAGGAHAENACPKFSKAQSDEIANQYLAEVLAGLLVEGKDSATKLKVERAALKKQVDPLVASGCPE